MRDSIRRLIIALCIVLSVGWPVVTHAKIDTIVKTGDRAPGTPSGVSFEDFYGTVLNATGDMSFRAQTSDNSDGIWVGPSGSLTLAAREGQHAPGTEGGVSFQSFKNPVLNAGGKVAFFARLSGTGITSYNDSGLWVGTQGDLTLVARAGDHAPGTPNGVVFNFIDQSPVLNSSGAVAFKSTIRGTGVTDLNNEGVWVGQPGNIAILAREGDTAPGTSKPFQFFDVSTFSRLALNAEGKVVFRGQLPPTITHITEPAIGVSVTPHSGIWIGVPGNLQLVARDDDPTTAGGLSGWQYISFGEPFLNGAGEVAFLSRITGQNKFENAILAGDPNNLDLVAWTGAGTTHPPEYISVGNPVLNDAGEVAFIGRIPDGSRAVIRAGSRNDLRTIAIQNFPAPGITGEAKFQSFTEVTLNKIGVVSFQARLSGSDVNHDNDEGIWAKSWKNQVPPKLILLAREGDLVEVTTGVFKKLETLLSPNYWEVKSGNADGLPSAFNDVSRQVFGPRLSDGTRAVLLAGLQPPIADRVRITNSWHKEFFPIMFQKPVVIVGPPTFYDKEPGVVRLRNLTGSNFEVRFQEWKYLDGTHTVQERLSYISIEEGRHTMSDNSIWEAGSFLIGGTGNWQQVSFDANFVKSPALFLTVQSYNGGDPVTVRAKNVGPEGFEAALFEEEALMNGHIVEKVGYLAIYSPIGSGAIDVADVSTPYLLQFPSIDHRFTPVLSSAIKLEEEKSFDTEVNHMNESASVLSLGDLIFAQVTSSYGADTVALRRLRSWLAGVSTNRLMEWGTISPINHIWRTVPFGRVYQDPPVVVVKPVSRRGSDPGVIRVRNVTNKTFDLRLQEWSYLDGRHSIERAFYLVAGAGKFDLDGLDVQAGKLNTNLLLEQGWQWVQFPIDFSDTPAVFAGVMTVNGNDPVLTRIKDVTRQGFSIAMDEEEALRGHHVRETLGWIAVERGGSILANNNRKVLVQSTSADDQFTTTSFSSSAARKFPFIIGDIVSANETDPVILRYQNLTPSSVELFLQEEQSGDNETNHVQEEVSLFVAE